MVNQIINIDFSPLWISLKTGIAATIISYFTGIYAADFVQKRGKKWGAILDSFFTLPLVLPPTVAGFLLLLLFSLNRPFGMFLDSKFEIRFVQNWLGCVVAATVISFPLMYRNAKAAFEQVDCSFVDAAKCLGMREATVFWKIKLPLASPGIKSGVVLAFVRSMGEYGATSMLAGNILGKTRTVSIAIATETINENYGKAAFWVIIVVVVGLLGMTGVQMISDKKVRK